MRGDRARENSRRYRSALSGPLPGSLARGQRPQARNLQDQRWRLISSASRDPYVVAPFTAPIGGGPKAARPICLPAVVREGPVRFRHAVRIVLLLNRVPLALAGRDELGGQALGHRLLRTGARVLEDPAHRQRGAALRTDFDRDLQGGTTDAAALHLEGRLRVVDRRLEHRHTRLPRL